MIMEIPPAGSRGSTAVVVEADVVFDEPPELFPEVLPPEVEALLLPPDVDPVALLLPDRVVLSS